MVALRSESPENLDISIEEQQRETMEREDAHSDKISEYELTREERIRENRERMQKLGIFDLSQKLNALKPTPKRTSHRKAPRSETPLPPSGPVRRSSRLQNSTPVSYSELPVAKKDKLLNDDDILRKEGSKPEVYTEEHEKLLGSTEMSWTLFVDGYGKDGKRIYDPIKGKTCHQCRQKTLGHRTHCSKCNMVQGQFCGDCLYMRYGENVLEAKANPNWICPVCRGICNCSLCRQAKGWPPTGILYKKISSLGHKSVAHFLIQTRRSTTNSEINAGVKVPISAKRSLPFSDIEVTEGENDLSKSSSECLNSDPLSVSDKETGDSKMTPEIGAEPMLNSAIATLMKDQVEHPLKHEPEKDGAGCDNEKEAKSLVDCELDESSMALKTELRTAAEPLNDPIINESNNYHKDESLIPETLERGDDHENKTENFILDNKDFIAPETIPKSTKKRVRYEPSPDSITARLRQKRNKANTYEETQLAKATSSTRNGEDASTTSDVDSIAGRLKMRRSA